MRWEGAGIRRTRRRGKHRGAVVRTVISEQESQVNAAGPKLLSLKYQESLFILELF